MSNFDYLMDFDKDFYKLAYLMEYYSYDAPENVRDYAEAVIKRLLDYLFNQIDSNYNFESYFESQVEILHENSMISDEFSQRLMNAYEVIENEFSKESIIAFQLNQIIFYIAKIILTDFEIPEYEPVSVHFDEFDRWYRKEMSFFRRNEKDELFVYYNELLTSSYIDLLGDGIPEAEIRNSMHISDETFEFLTIFDADFTSRIMEAKRKLIMNALGEGKAKSEILTLTGLTSSEYDNIVDVANFRGDELSKLRADELNSRKDSVITNLKENSLEDACRISGVTMDDFFEIYENDNGEFHRKATEILMDKYLEKRSEGFSRLKSVEMIGLDENYLQRWLNWSDYSDFQDKDNELNIHLITEGFRNSKSKSVIAEIAEIDKKTLNAYLKLGREGDKDYCELYECYEKHAVSKYLDEILNSKSIKAALESSDLEREELNYYYNQGKSGNEKYSEFYQNFLNAKKDTYVNQKSQRKSHKIALRESLLDASEYREYKDELDRALKMQKLEVVRFEIEDGRNTTVAASKAKVTVDEIYDWYFRGRDGDEDFTDFYEFLHTTYVKPRLDYIDELLANKDFPDFAKNRLTRKDLEIWVENDMLYSKVVSFDEPEEEKPKDPEEDEILSEMGFGQVRKVRSKNNSSTILNRTPEDIEKMKREILRK